MTTDKIDPALSAEEFASLRDGTLSEVSLTGIADILTNPYEHDDAVGAARLVAAYNTKLPDSDLRKITRPKLAALCLLVPTTSWLAPWVYALESYLPPEEP